MLKIWRDWPLKNTTLLVLGLGLFLFFIESPQVAAVLKTIGGLGYLGAFIAGAFFVSTYTVAPSAVILYDLAQTHHPLATALIAGLGAMIGDYLIFRLFRDRIFEELHPIFSEVGGKYVRPLFKTPAFGWLLPFLGAVIIASPIPDEIGVGMLGLSKLKPWQFMFVAFALNAAGIFVIVLAARS